ncbi:MAG: hypothetical protein WDN31_18195 [Hyphomicrobium sp.]
MSYDFTMFKPRGTINSMAEIEPANLRLQDGDAIKTKLTALFPAIEWGGQGRTADGSAGWRPTARGTSFGSPPATTSAGTSPTSEGNEEGRADREYLRVVAASGPSTVRR